MQTDAEVGSQVHDRAIAVGGRLTDLTPTLSKPIGGLSWINSASTHSFQFKGGLRLGQGIPLDFSWFQRLADSLQPTSGWLNHFEVHVVCAGGTYSIDDFCPGCPNERISPSGRNFLVVVQTTQTVTIRGSPHGRQFFGSILAPFAEVIVDGSVGFIDGFVVAKKYKEVGAGVGSLHIHGHCYAEGGGDGLSCVNSGSACQERRSESSTTCTDRLKTAKCQKKQQKNKCQKQRVRTKKCPLTCGGCSATPTG